MALVCYLKEIRNGEFKYFNKTFYHDVPDGWYYIQFNPKNGAVNAVVKYRYLSH